MNSHTPSQKNASANKNVLIIGGSGYLGCYIVKECINQGYSVTVMARTPDKASESFQRAGISTMPEYIVGDINQLQEEDYCALLKPFNHIIFAAGLDERTKPIGDAYTFYANANISPCEKLFKAAQKTNISHAVLLNSIFSTMDRQHPEQELAEKHPYIRCRVEQNRVAQELASDHFVLSTLEVPWVFGKSFNGDTPWKTLIDYTRGTMPLSVCNGGTSVIAASSVAQAAVNALRNTESCATPIGDLNLSYKEMVEILCECLQVKGAQVYTVSDDLFRELMRTGNVFKEFFAYQTGLNTLHLPDLLLQNLFVDVEASLEKVHYETGVAKQAIAETVAQAPETIYMKNWRHYLNMFRQSMNMFSPRS